VIDAATATRFQEAADSLPPLAPAEQEVFEEYLRRWLNALAPSTAELCSEPVE
jgi:hypothetical protein